MNKTRYIGLVFLLLAFSACEVIPLDEAYDQQPIDTMESDTATFSSDRKVLLEYYTGHLCGNCPKSGGTQLKALKDLYGNRLIVMSVHTGWFARITSSYPADYNTDAGDALEAEFQAIASGGTPIGMVNRADYNGTAILSPAAWGSAVQDDVSNQAKVGVTGSFLLNSLNGTVSGEVRLMAFEELSQTLDVDVYVTEDSIVGKQKDYTLEDQDILDYVHRYVLRGQLVTSDNFPASMLAGEEVSLDFSGALSAYESTSNLEAIIVVQDPSSGEVLQAGAFALK